MFQTGNFTTTFSTGTYAISREQPTLTITANNAVMYDLAYPNTHIYPVSNQVNSDTSTWVAPYQVTYLLDGVRLRTSLAVFGTG
jgi:hypothetical protein